MAHPFFLGPEITCLLGPPQKLNSSSVTSEVDFRSNLHAQSPRSIPYPLPLPSHSLLRGDQPSRSTEPGRCPEHHSHSKGGPRPHGCGKFCVLPDDPSFRLSGRDKSWREVNLGSCPTPAEVSRKKQRSGDMHQGVPPPTQLGPSTCPVRTLPPGPVRILHLGRLEVSIGLPQI